MNQELAELISQQTETTRIRCPVCADDRKKSHLKSMGISVEDNRVVYQCFHCGTSGAVKKDRFMYQVKELTKNVVVIHPPT
jgi:DNA-directed RNA polymerase subunit RPC12/RpoP